MNVTNGPVVILWSPIDGSGCRSIEGIDVNPNHILSVGGGFIRTRTVPLKDTSLKDRVIGIYTKERYMCIRSQKQEQYDNI